MSALKQYKAAAKAAESTIKDRDEKIAALEGKLAKVKSQNVALLCLSAAPIETYKTILDLVKRAHPEIIEMAEDPRCRDGFMAALQLAAERRDPSGLRLRDIIPAAPLDWDAPVGPGYAQDIVLTRRYR